MKHYEIRPRSAFQRTQGDEGTAIRERALRRALETRDNPATSREDRDQAMATIGVLSPHFEIRETGDAGRSPGNRVPAQVPDDYNAPPVSGPGPDQRDVPETRGAGREARTEADEAFTRYLRSGDTRGLFETRVSAGLTTAPTEAGQTDSANAGYQVPEGFWRNLQVALKAFGGMSRDFRQVETETGNPMPWPTVDPTAVTASVLGNELTQLTVSNPYVFGQGKLNAWTIATDPILASLQLVRDSAFDVDEFVSARIGEAVGRTMAAKAVSGTGSGEHLGIITALDARGAWTTGSSGGYIALGAATSVNTLSGSVTELAGNLLAPDTLLSMIEAVDPAYRDLGAKFYVSDAQLKGLRTVVDQYGHPLLQNPAHESGEPRLWGYPVVVVPEIPALTASTTGGPVFGHLASAMVQRTVMDAAILRLQERYADYLAIGYLGYVRSDFRSNDLRAAVTVQANST